MQSIDRAMLITKMLVESPGGELSISELSKESGLPVSTMHRLLKAMQGHGLIGQDPSTKCYRLGTLWLEYGLKLYDTLDYVSEIRPVLEALSKEIGENVYLYKLTGKESLIIERLDYIQEDTLSVTNQIGLRTPLNEGAANIAMVSKFDKMAKEEVLNTLNEDKKQHYLSKINDVEEKGYVTMNDEIVTHTITIASPVLNTYKEVQGAVGITVVSFDLDDETVMQLGKAVRKTAAEINKKLGN